MKKYEKGKNIGERKDKINKEKDKDRNSEKEKCKKGMKIMITVANIKIERKQKDH